ncbi:MAG: AMP-binding protein [Bacteroidales bacterium]|nr:AMP-binding protein [Bacteroidales bacterium]
MILEDNKYISISKVLESSFRDNWDRVALTNYHGNALTYRDTAVLIEKLHIAFRANGLKKGERIAICSRNQANWCVAFIAGMTYGAVVVPILHEFKPENIQFLVCHSDARVLFVDEHIWENLSESSMPGLSMVCNLNDFSCLFNRDGEENLRESVLEKYAELHPDGFGPEKMDYCDYGPEELAIINYTSGTSGFSKGVMLPHRSLWRNLYFSMVEAEPQMTCESEIVSMLPSAHMYGMMFEFIHELAIGGNVHFLTRVPSPKVILSAFAEVHPDLIIAVPLIIEKVYKSQIKPVIDRNKRFLSIPILDQYVLKKIRNGMIEAFGGRFEEIILGGAAFNPEVEHFLRKIHFPFTVGYGMTECGPIITYSKWWKSREGSCGKPIGGCKVKIDSADPANVPGEILIQGDNVFLGYYKNEEATKEVFTEDGWFKTGDMGVMDKDGFLYLRGRCKCVILGSSGQNIYPEELEAVVNTVNYVLDSLVIEEGGSLTVLVYPDYRQAEIDGLSRDELDKRLNESLPQINQKLPTYAQIKKMEFMPEDFERTPKRNIKRYLYQRS